MVRKELLVIKIIINLVLIGLVVFIRIDFLNKQRNIELEKIKYNNYISNLAIIYSNKNVISLDNKFVKEKFNKFMNYLENSGIIFINRFSEDSGVNINFAIQKDYFLNFIKYMYNNSDSFELKKFDFSKVEGNHVYLDLSIAYLYSIPKDYIDYFSYPEGLKIKFWAEELINLQKLISSRQSNLKESQKLSEQYPTSEKSQIHEEEINLPIKYKGFIKVGNIKYAIIEYENQEFFINSIYNLGDYQIKVKSIEKDYLKIEVRGKELVYKLELI